MGSLLRHSISTSSPFPGAVEWNFDALFLLDKAGVPAGRYSAMELDRASE